MTKDKLGSELETKTPLQELKFTDYVINKYQSDSSQKTKKGKTRKTIKKSNTCLIGDHTFAKKIIKQKHKKNIYLAAKEIYESF